jgi:tetraacyldisaccharide 4'-kinase
VAREPSWWYGPASSWQASTLAPAAAIYGRVALRRLSGNSFEPALPVICVGNFTAGGTGKTPLVRVIAKLLAAQNHKPAILSRGHGGTSTGPHWVDAARDTAHDVGDEPLLLAITAPVMIARDRRAGAAAIEAAASGFTAIVMDDGLQNPALVKRLTISVVDGTRGFGNGRVIPAGPLRAPLDAQLKRADAIVVNRGHDTTATSAIAEHLRATFSGPVIEAAVAPVGATAGATDWLAGAPVLAYAGIGAPDRFFKLLERLGATLAGTRRFADHHAFTPEDARSLLRDARALGATLITTEKDHVRLSNTGPALAELATATRTLPIELVLQPTDEERLRSLLAAAMTPKSI